MPNRSRFKHIRMFRHSLDENNFISITGYKLIQAAKNSFLDTDLIFIGPQTRFAQTASAMLYSINRTDCNIVTVEALAFNDVQGQLVRDEDFLKIIDEHPIVEIYPIIRRKFTELEIAYMEAKCADAITSCFNLMEPGASAMLIASNPYIVMAFNHFSQKKVKHDLAHMDFLDLHCR